jgi:1-acyl-sn-glycerol-3-phosphate acyltransferase
MAKTAAKRAAETAAEAAGQVVQYSSPLRSFYRLALYFSWVLVAIPIQAVARLFRLPLAKRLPQTVHRGCVWILGAKLVVRGTKHRKGPVLYVVNHTSYVDITFLGALIRASFIAKAEVAKWPFFGLCAKLQETVFVDRNPRKAAEQTDMLREHLRKGARLILFPEGTSNDGNHVLPFRSALFSAAEIRLDDGTPVTVQPVSIAYTHLDGIPMGRHFRPFFAWYGDMELMSHLWQLLGIGRVRVVVEFHKPVTIDQFKSRKEMATYCQAVVAAGVSRAVTGREQPVLAPAPGAVPAEPAAGTA